MTDPSTIRVGQHMQVTIERLVFQGSGLGRLLDERVIFVPYTVPGDEVEITVTQVREDFVQGNLVRVLSPASSRVTPACRYFGNCGGCQWQRVAYPSQLAWKQEILRELLARIGKLGEATNSIPMADPIPPAHPWEYRARAQLKVVGGGRLHVGFHQQETHRVVDIDRCPLLHPRLNMGRSWSRWGEHRLRVDATAFFQVSGSAAETLMRLVMDGSWDLIVLDPPRQGASRWVLDTILAMAIPRILYVSCDPSTLARDLGILIPSGYRCVALTPVDLFPQTFHLETVAVLERAA